MDEAEWLTRKMRIDTKLRSLSPQWQIIRYRDGLELSALHCTAVEEFPTANGPADYALFVNGQLLGIIEAKKVTVDPQNVLEQARRYAEGAFQGPGNWNGFRVPFLYAANGEIFWHLDARPEKRVSRQLANFHTANALEELFALDVKPAHTWLLDSPPERIARLRPYQISAITATEAASAPVSEIKERGFKLDITWLKDDSLNGGFQIGIGTSPVRDGRGRYCLPTFSFAPPGLGHYHVRNPRLKPWAIVGRL